MKKKLFSFVLCLLIFTVMILPVSAKSDMVLDIVGVMTSEEASSLTEQILPIQHEYGLDVVVLTVPNLMGSSAQEFADDFYDNNGYGENGVLFLLDLGSRQWHISTSGTAIEALSDRDLMEIEERVIPYFSEGRFYDGFCRFLDILPDYLSNGEGSGINFLLSLLIGAGVSGIVILIMRSTMNTKKPRHSAEGYTVENSWHLRQHLDLFLYSNVTKRAKPKNNSSGSSVHRSSSGRSHGGRGGRF